MKLIFLEGVQTGTLIAYFFVDPKNIKIEIGP
jgi:hypothetical protein